jgi:FAD-dependent oxidoreductase domain-containing protein 1
MDDVIVVGGGIIGASTAYFLSKAGRKVRVFERDPTYKNASFPLSLGGFRRQFFQKENILLGKFAKEFIFQLPDLLKTKKMENQRLVWFLTAIFCYLAQSRRKNNMKH